MSGPLVAIVHVGRSPGMGGGRRRVESWSRIFEAAGAQTADIPLLGHHRAVFPATAPRDLFDLVQGRVVPEVVAWSLSSVRRELQELQPDVIVLGTARTYRPAIAELAPIVILDFIDRLSLSYAQRTTIAGSPLRRLGYRALSPLHGRFERGADTSGAVKVAAGWRDALALGAVWVPITCEAKPVVDVETADHDLVFLGTLSYPPNIEALERLSRLWPSLLVMRPATTLLVAGASPPRRVVSLARRHNWTLSADFGDVSAVLRRARLAVAPLAHSSGVQIKVLEAAAHGLAQVLTPTAVAGFGPGFPATIAEDDKAFAGAVVEMLDDDERRHREGRAAREHVLVHYSSTTWGRWAKGLLCGEHPPSAFIS